MKQALVKSMPLKKKYCLPLWSLILAHGILLAILASNFLQGLHVHGLNGDIDGYQKIGLDIESGRLGSEGLYYHHYHYPPLANLLFFIAHLNSLGMSYDIGLLITTILFSIAGFLYLYDSVSPSHTRLVFLGILISIVLLEPATFFARYDFFPMLCMMLAAFSARAKKWGHAGILLGAAIYLKFAPVFLLPLFWVMAERKERLRFIGGIIVASLVTWVLTDLIIGSGETLRSLFAFGKLRESQPPYVFSTAASIDIFVQKFVGRAADIQWVNPNLGHFVMDMPSIVPTVLQMLSLGGAFLIAWIARRDKKRSENILFYIAATLTWLLFATPFATMHYYLWALPFVFVALLERSEETMSLPPWLWTMAITGFIVSLLGQYSFPFGYYDLVFKQEWLPVTVNVVRNFGMLLLSFASLKSIHSTLASRS